MVELSLERSQHCDRDGQSAVGVIPLRATNAFNHNYTGGGYPVWDQESHARCGGNVWLRGKALWWSAFAVAARSAQK